eukprot:4756657-Pyramimonas_sp.AAC.1
MYAPVFIYKSGTSASECLPNYAMTACVKSLSHSAKTTRRYRQGAQICGPSCYAIGDDDLRHYTVFPVLRDTATK